jgi:UDP-galactopyranose mutase
LGAGLTGLSAAYHLGDEDGLVIEQQEQVGGNCRTLEQNGFYFDLGGHIFYPKEAAIRELVRELLGANCNEADRQAWIYSHDTYTRYPFQANLYGLPADIIRDCLLGLHEAELRIAREGEVTPKDFLDFIYRTFGTGIARHFMIDFNRKHWKYPLDEITLDWMGKFIPRPGFSQALEGSLQPAEKCIGQNARFLYPDHGGIQAVCDGFKTRTKMPFELHARVTALDLEKRSIEINNRETVGYKRVLSTLPLPVLVACTRDVPPGVQDACARLKWNSEYVVSVAVNKPELTARHRIYCSDPELIFHKLAFFSSYAPRMAPEGQCAVSCEVIFSERAPADRGTLEKRVIKDLRKMDILKPQDEILFTHVAHMPYAYVIYDRERADAVAAIRSFYEAHDVHCWGRYAEWAYQNMEQNIRTGRDVALQLKK